MDRIQRVEDDRGVASALGHPPRALDRHLRDLRLLLDGPVEAAARNGQRGLGMPFGDLLRPHPREHDRQLDLRMRLGDRERDAAKQRRGPRPGRAADGHARPLPERRVF